MLRNDVRIAQNTSDAYILCLQAALMFCILVSDFTVTCSTLVQPGYFCDMPVALTVAQFVRWTGWNTMLLEMTFDGSTMLVRVLPGKAEQKNIWCSQWHWLKVLTWIVNEGACLGGCLCNASPDFTKHRSY
jgi:hypothetical protein